MDSEYPLLFTSEQLASFVLPRVNFEKTASRFASVTSEEIIQSNDKAVPENTKKETQFGLFTNAN